MNKEKLAAAITRYKTVLTQVEHGQDEAIRKQRIAYYGSYDSAKILAMTEDDFVKFVGTLWAAGMYGNKHYLANKIIDANNGLGVVKKLLAEFLFGANPLSKRWDMFLKQANMFGPSYMSELLCHCYPQECAITNNQVLRAVEYLECGKMPRYNYQFTGKVYEKICAVSKEIQKELQQNGVDCPDLLAVNYFLWEVANAGNSTPQTEPEIEQSTEREKEFIHDEVKEKIVEIGKLLGFNSSAEVKVAKGAVVDAVWEANIGNMGRVMYVFEVQTKGSIDSMLMNLQRAYINKAVQVAVAVSDLRQIEKIKGECEGLKHFEIKYWNYEEVLEVYENLGKAMSSINNLGLVPKEF